MRHSVPGIMNSLAIQSINNSITITQKDSSIYATTIMIESN